MCGIWVYLQKNNTDDTTRGVRCDKQLYDSFMNLSSRGPDKSTLIKLPKYGLYIGFHRLAIMDTTVNGDQPFVIELDDKIIYLVCNGEIYNHNELKNKYSIQTKSNSDCEVLLHLYLSIGFEQMLNEIDGEFAVCICEIDKNTTEVKMLIARDHCGIRPMFITGSSNDFLITSECKGMIFSDYHIQQMKPRTYLEISNRDDKMYNMNLNFVEYMSFDNINSNITDIEIASELIRDGLIKSVKQRMINERGNVGCLLSGGLDSSLIASIASNICKENNTQLHTFSIGLDGSTDREYAKLVSEHIDSIHHDILVSTDDFIKSVEEVIRITETFDITTVRASVGQYLISKWISKNTDIKVLLVGDGSDELTGGYLYTKLAPSINDFQNETLYLINNIHYFDVLRSDRCIANNGLEARVPFLSKQFIETYLSIDPTLRIAINNKEKWLLRHSFDKNGQFLPYEVLYRQKEAFSDGVSSEKDSWYKIMQTYIETIITDKMLLELQKKYTHNIPKTKEALYYRLMYEMIYNKHDDIIPHYWMPKWCEDINEPSARNLKIY